MASQGFDSVREPGLATEISAEAVKQPGNSCRNITRPRMVPAQCRRCEKVAVAEIREIICANRSKVNSPGESRQPSGANRGVLFAGDEVTSRLGKHSSRRALQ